MRILIVLAGLALAQSSSSAANIVLDPSFENAVFAPWVSAGHPWGIDSANAHTGSQSAGTGCVGIVCIAADPNANGAWIYQDLATSTSATYTLSFWIGLRGTNGGTTPNELAVLWNGVQVFDLKDDTQVAFTQYTVTGLTTPNTTTRLEFLGRNDPNVIDIDDISVDSSVGTPGGAPEPATWGMLGAGLVGIAAWRRAWPQMHAGRRE